MSSLSKSKLWEMMHAYYDNLGPEAWAEEIVPLQISSNLSLAKTYADLIISNINDWLINSYTKPSDSIEPFYIIEVGAGHGKFGFYMAKTLQKMLENYEIQSSSVKYIMTDISDQNIASWKNHSALQEFFQSGILDVANFNAISDTELNLQFANTKILPKSLKTPVFMICNYLFDTLPHDAFYIKNNKLFETNIEITSTDNWKEYFEKAQYKFTNIEVNCSDYYQDQTLNNILCDYQQQVDNCSVVIPTGGFDCVKTIANFTQDSMMLLIADKGYSHTDLFDEDEKPDISFHGSVSLMVNFDAIAKYFTANNGASLLMNTKTSEFQVGCFIQNNNYNIPNTRHSFDRNLGAFSPQDLFNLSYNDDEANESINTIDQIISLLNMCDWDSNIFCDFADNLIELIEENEVDIEQEANLVYGATKAWEYFFKLEKSQDLAYAVGGVFYALDMNAKAIEYYRVSVETFGEYDENLYNLAICLQLEEQEAEAKVIAKRILEINPEYDLARDLLKELS